ncbi:MAG: SDR family oxidoreductase [Pseudomonadota bacterium]
MDTKILITGGAGFIGSHLAEALLAKGCGVTVLDNLSTGNLRNLAAVNDRIRFIEGDIRNAADIEKAISGCAAVVHLAAMVLVPQTIDDPVGAALINEIGSLNVLEAARKNGCRRVVLASSAAVYGNNPDLPKHERMASDPLSPYAVQKLAMEHYAGLYHILYGLETVSLRFFNVFGPRQDPSSPYSGVISIFLEKASRSKAPAIFGDGLQTRDFIYVTDVAAACVAAIKGGGAGQVFNIGTGHQTTIRRLWGEISAIAGAPRQPQIAPERPGDVRHSVADITRASQILGFRPTVSLEDGLRTTCEWYRSFTHHNIKNSAYHRETE